MDDLISRQAAIEALHMHLMYRMGTDSNKKRLDDWINGVPPAQSEPCEDAVNRETLLKFFDGWMSALDENCHNQSVSDLKIIKRDFANLPSVTPKQRTGKWIKCGWAIKCSECDYDMPYTVRNYCPNCGCRMDGGEQ